MAGQPQEPSWQPAERDSWQAAGPDQAREAWPPAPSFTPQQASPLSSQPASQEDTYTYAPTPPTYAEPPPTYAEPPAYAEPPPYGQPPAYGQPDPQGQQGQSGQGYPPPTYGPKDQAMGQGMGQNMGQGVPQWQASPGMSPATARPRGEKGFIGSLFDFSFKSMVTPKIIRVLYVLITAWVALWAIIFLVIAFRTGGVAGGIFTLIVIDPILVLLSLGAYRVILELCMVIFRLHEDVKAIRDRGDRPL